MTPAEAVDVAYNGRLVECEKADYPAVRSALQEAAAGYMDRHDMVRAMIALGEVKRLDALHGFDPFAEQP